MVPPVNVDALLDFVRKHIPPEYLLVVRPENETEARECLDGMENGHQVELVVSPEMPWSDTVILMRKDVLEPERVLTDRTRPAQPNNGPLFPRSFGD